MPRAAAATGRDGGHRVRGSRAGIAVVRVLDRDVIGQAHGPQGGAGRVTAWEMAHRPSNRQRSRWAVALLDVRPATGP